MEDKILMIGGVLWEPELELNVQEIGMEEKSAKCSSKKYARRPPHKPIPPKGK